MLFIQGTRDALADIALLSPTVETLGEHATLARIEGADHAFHVPARYGRTTAQVLDEILDKLAGWTEDVISRRWPSTGARQVRRP
jgi:hypothetical protein